MILTDKKYLFFSLNIGALACFRFTKSGQCLRQTPIESFYGDESTSQAPSAVAKSVIYSQAVF